jgi:GT2 family glycosyltransferase
MTMSTLMDRVSVVVLNYNKKDVLRESLQDVLQLDWPDLEFIVVDNASSDGSADMVEAEFGGRVRVERREVNSVTAGRNAGFRSAQGEYILSLDNDIRLPDKQVLRKGLEIFEKRPAAGLLAFRIGHPEDPEKHLPEHWWHPVPLAEGVNRFFLTSYFTESAVLLRKKVFEATGGYDEDFFMGVEQIDLALKIIGAGQEIVYCPNLMAVETEVRGMLAPKPSRIHYLNIRNKLWTAWKHYPVGRALVYAASRILASGLRSVRYGWTRYFLTGLKDGIWAPASIRRKRNPLPPEAWAVYDKIQRGWFLD